MIFDIKEVTIRKLDEHDDLSYFTSSIEDFALKFRLIRKHEKKKYPTMYFNLITPNNM